MNVVDLFDLGCRLQCTGTKAGPFHPSCKGWLLGQPETAPLYPVACARPRPAETITMRRMNRHNGVESGLPARPCLLAVGY